MRPGSKSENALQGQALYWASYDRSGVVTAALAGLLKDLVAVDQVRLKLVRAVDPQACSQIVDSQTIGLACWVVQELTELPAICQSIRTARRKRTGPVCIAFTEAPVLDEASILMESGAHLVLSSLSALQIALPKALRVVPYSSQALHPLTNGLLARLPWGEV